MSKLELAKDAPLFIERIEDVLQTLYNQFRAVDIRNEYLEEENKRLKSESYKDEELSKMRSELESMKSSYFRGFPISEKEEKKINDWKKEICDKYPSNAGIIGGTFTSYDMAKTFMEGQNYVIAHPEKFGLCKAPAEWSEEEKKHLYNAIEAVKYVYDISEGTSGFKCVEFLKSLRPKPHWKPSKKQMWALEWKINNTPVHAWQRKELESLYNNLQKLI